MRVLALSSGGGHWIQMLRITPAFEGCDVAFATTDGSYREHLQSYRERLVGARFYVVHDASLPNVVGLLKTAFDVARVIWIEKPDAIFTTGASPGFFALMFGKLSGAKTIWLDSIANVHRMSRSGRKARYFADLWLTQSPDLATPRGPRFAGRVVQ